MTPTLFLLGPSDKDKQQAIEKVRVETGEQSHRKRGAGWQLSGNFTGVLPIMPFIQSDQMLRENSETVILGLHKLRLRRGATVNVFNLVGDADASARMLSNIDALVEKIRPKRCFNPVPAVRATSRAQLPTTLAGISNCVVPQVEAINPVNFEELRALCDEFDHWPCIVRSRGQHGGEQMQLVNHPSDLEAIGGLSWLYEGLFIIQYIDCRTEDGLFQKQRVVMIDGVPYMRQCVFSDHWAIHAGSRAALMDADDALCQREENMLAEFREGGLKDWARVFQQIHRRCGLDVFGIDFALLDDRLVIFEANACMRFLGRDDVTNPRYVYTRPYKLALRDALKTMLMTN